MKMEKSYSLNIAFIISILLLSSGCEQANKENSSNVLGENYLFENDSFYVSIKKSNNVTTKGSSSSNNKLTLNGYTLNEIFKTLYQGNFESSKTVFQRGKYDLVLESKGSSIDQIPIEIIESFAKELNFDIESTNVKSPLIVLDSVDLGAYISQDTLNLKSNGAIYQINKSNLNIYAQDLTNISSILSKQINIPVIYNGTDISKYNFYDIPIRYSTDSISKYLDTKGLKNHLDSIDLRKITLE